jgi:hypothetical protein
VEDQRLIRFHLANIIPGVAPANQIRLGNETGTSDHVAVAIDGESAGPSGILYNGDVPAGATGAGLRPGLDSLVVVSATDLSTTGPTDQFNILSDLV